MGSASDATLKSQMIALLVMVIGLVIFVAAGLRYLRRSPPAVLPVTAGECG